MTVFDILNEKAPDELASLWVRLNKGQWPDELGAAAHFDSLDRERQHEMILPPLMFILDKIGLKSCLREWNKTLLPGQKFDDWWRSTMEKELQDTN